MVYKDKQPRETVDCISTYLNSDYALTFSCCSSNTWQAAPSFTLTNFELGLITNGKGTTKEYAQASAFGEFFERFFNITFVRFGNATPLDLGVDYPYPCQGRAEVYAQIKVIATQGTEDVAEADSLAILFMNLIDAYYGKVLPKIPCIAFQNFRAEQLFLPVPIADILIGTNGMAAGNTFEEAFVQAFSEVMERRAIMDLNAGLVIPDLVDEEILDVPILKLFKESFDVNEDLLFKTFTFERYYHFPVVAFLIIDLKQKKYKIRFGAHCNLRYALERCVTETVQGAEIQDYSKWISIKRACSSNDGESIGLFTDGSGTISSIALENLLLAKDTYGTNWTPETNIDAFNSIKLCQPNIYFTVNKTSPAVALQLFIPGRSYITWPSKNDLERYIDKYQVIRQLLRFIRSDKKNIDNFCEIYRLLSERYISATSLNLIVQFLCPIQLQYLRLVKIEDLSLIVKITNKDFSAVAEYFYRKSEKNPGDEYSHYATIFARYAERNEQVPDSIRVFFTKSIRTAVEKDFASCFEALMDLDYCKKCPRKGLANCIHEEKKRVCRLILENNENISA